MNRSVAIIRTGTANLASVVAAFARLDARSRIVDSPDDVRDDDATVLPGVGTFDAGVDALNKYGWPAFLVERWQNDFPVLAVCLGLQLLARSSEEAPGRRGLGLLPATARSFPPGVCSPQLGWNQVNGTGAMIRGGFAYFANSFCLTEIRDLRSDGWCVATSNHGVDFVAAIQKGNWLACQFHPELSGSYGLQLLQNWLVAADETQPILQRRGLQC